MNNIFDNLEPDDDLDKIRKRKEKKDRKDADFKAKHDKKFNNEEEKVKYYNIIEEDYKRRSEDENKNKNKRKRDDKETDKKYIKNKEELKRKEADFNRENSKLYIKGEKFNREKEKFNRRSRLTIFLDKLDNSDIPKNLIPCIAGYICQQYTQYKENSDYKKKVKFGLIRRYHTDKNKDNISELDKKTINQFIQSICETDLTNDSF